MAKLIQFQTTFFHPREVAQVSYDGRNVTVYTRSSPKESELRFPSSDAAARAVLGLVAALEEFGETENMILAALKAIEDRNKERHEQVMKTQAEIAQQLRDAGAAIAAIGVAPDAAATAATAASTSSAKSAEEIKKLQKLIEDLKAAIETGGNASEEVEAAADALAAQIGVVAASATAASNSATAAQVAAKTADDLVPDPADPPPAGQA